MALTRELKSGRRTNAELLQVVVQHRSTDSLSSKDGPDIARLGEHSVEGQMLDPVLVVIVVGLAGTDEDWRYHQLGQRCRLVLFDHRSKSHHLTCGTWLKYL